MTSHGVVLPDARKHTPARVLNLRSRVREDRAPLKLDKLLKASHPRICIKRRLGGIGDVLMTTPALKAIKTLIPRCELTYATDLKYSNGALADIIGRNPYVDRLIQWQEAADQEWDYSIDITTTGLSKEKSGSIPPNRIDMFAEAIGVDISSDPAPTYILDREEILRGQKKIKEIIGKTPRTKATIVVIQARSNDARRTWALERVQQLAELLAQDPDCYVVLMDWGHDIKRWIPKERVTLIFDQTLSETASIVNACDVVICPDSSMLHLAGALNKKTVTIFGPIPPQSRINHYPNTVAVIHELPCQFCFYSPRCTKNGGHKLACLDNITVEDVAKMVRRKAKEPDRIHASVQMGQDLTTAGQDPIILVKRTTPGIGDILMALPGIEALKAKYPEKQIHLALQKKLWPAVQGCPAISELIDCNDPINYKRYYMTVDISVPCAKYEYSRVQTAKPVEKSRVEIYSEAMGIRESITDLLPRYYPTKDELSWAKSFLAKEINPEKPTIAVGLSSNEIYRNWPPGHYQTLFNILKGQYNFVTLDATRTIFYEGVIDGCGFPLRRAAAVLLNCDGLLTVDTSLLHIAASKKLPTIAMFGPIDYKARCKGYSNITVVTANMNCIPCWRNGNTKCDQTGKVRDYSLCLSNIDPAKIADIIKNKFSGRQ